MKQLKEFMFDEVGLDGRVDRIHGSRGLGGHWLGFRVSLSPRRDVRFHISACQLAVHSRGGGVWGTTEWSVPAWRSMGEPRSMPVELRLAATAEQLLLLDAGRDARGSVHLQTWLTIVGDVSEADGTSHGGWVSSITRDSEIELEQSDWQRLLKEMSFEERIVFEVPVAGHRVPEALTKAGERLKAARVAFHERRWDDVLLRCREVIDEIYDKRPLPVPNQQAPKLEANLDSRFASLVKAVRDVTHRGAHGAGKNSIEGDPDYNHAEFILHATALSLKHAALR